MPQVSEEEAKEIQKRIEAVSANSRQVGGSHYRDVAKGGGEQHWDMMWRLYREAWFVGNVTKYVTRYRRKFGMEDLLKARHYLEKLIELETAEAVANGEELPEELSK